MIVCKLTDKDMRTYGGTQWVVGKWRNARGKGPLCTVHWLHWYSSPLLAALHHPLHVTYAPPIRAWEAEADGTIKIEPMKGGSSRLRLLKEIELPEVSLAVRVRYAIYCAQLVVPVDEDITWHKWADAWLEGRRDKESTERAYYTATWVPGQSAAWSALVSFSSVEWSKQYCMEYAAEAVARSVAWSIGHSLPPLNLQDMAERAVEDEAALDNPARTGGRNRVSGGMKNE